MKVIIIDNYDSFTYNIVHYVEQFCENCTVVKIDEISFEEMDHYDKIILSPGPGLPKDRPILNRILSRYQDTKPILGICLGHQAISEFYGSCLYNMDQVHHGVARLTTITKPDYLWKNIPIHFLTGRYHSWAVSQVNFSENLEILAIDHETKTIMAFKHKTFDIRGVQFHPESILTEFGLELIKNWVQH